MRTPNFEAFAADVMSNWQEGIYREGIELQQMAIRHGLLTEVEGGFDPSKHKCPFDASEPGDTWYEQQF